MEQRIITTDPGENETKTDYLYRIGSAKKSGLLNLSWEDVGDLLLEHFGDDRSGEAWRNSYNRLATRYKLEQSQQQEQIFTENNNEYLLLNELKSERYKLCDVRNQISRDIRRMSREETLKEIAVSVTNELNIKLPLKTPEKESSGNRAAIALLSDVHYGIEIDNYYNKYDIEIAKERLLNFQTKILEFVGQFNVGTLHFFNLGDLIAGRIHETIKYQSRIDVITQIIEVSELVAQMLNNLSSKVNIKYYDCLDNHARLEPNLSDSLKLESLARLTKWHIKTRLYDNDRVEVFDNEIAPDIITAEINGWNVVAVHGDRDKPKTIVQKLRGYVGDNIDLVCSAHLHHFSANEEAGTLHISNGSMMGTDDFAENLRLHSEPSQTLILVGKDSVCDIIKKVDLN